MKRVVIYILLIILCSSVFAYADTARWIELYAKKGAKHSNNEGTDHPDVELNTTHRTSDGKDHSDVVLNNTHRGSDGSDHGFIDQDVTIGSAPSFGALTISDFSNATHDHEDASGGAQLDHTAALTNVGTNTHAQVDTHIEHLVDQFMFGFVTTYDGAQQTTIAFDGTNLFTLSPTGATFDYYRNGVKYTITGNKTVTLPGTPVTTGHYYIYIDATDGTLTASTTSWTLEDTKVPVATVAFNNTLTPVYWMSDERHANSITRRDHWEHHFAEGSEAITNGGLSGYTVGGSTDAENTFGIGASVLADEDLKIILDALTDPDGINTDYVIQYPVAGVWMWEASAMPYRYTAAGYIQYNNAGTMTQGQNNKFYNTYLLFTNMDGAARYELVHGEGEFSTNAGAQAERFTDLDLAGLVIDEYVAVFQLTWQSSAALGTKGKAKLSHEPVPISVSASGSSSTVSNDHSTLTHLDWLNTGHSGTASNFAGFDATGAAAEYPEVDYFLTDGSRDITFPATSINFTQNSYFGGFVSMPEIELVSTIGDIGSIANLLYIRDKDNNDLCGLTFASNDISKSGGIGFIPSTYTTTFNPSVDSTIAVQFAQAGAGGPVYFNGDSVNKRIGIGGVTDPDTTLEVFYAGTQVKLSYDATNYTTFAAQSDGDLTIDSNKASYDFDFGDGNILTTGTVDGIDVAGRDHNAVTLNASSTTGGMSLATQEISNRAATNAQTGYATAAHITAIEANTGKDTNVTTNLSLGAIDGTTMVVVSSDGTDVTLIEADTDDAGLLGATKWDEIVASTSHISADGSSHTFIDQSVISGASPTFTTVTGDITGNSGTVTTITGLAPDTATTQATQAAITTAANLVSVGALNSGSITSGFGNIDNGSSTLDTGALTSNGINDDADTTVVTILNNENVGIQTAVPHCQLNVYEPGAAVNEISLQNSNTGNLASDGMSVQIDTNGVFQLINREAQGIYLATNVATAAMTIDTSQVVQFNGSTYTSNGTVSTSAGNGTLVTASDKTKKNHIRDFDTASTPLLLQLQPVVYTWKHDEGKNPFEEVGFYSQDVNAVIPDIAPKTTVLRYKDENDKTKIKGVKLKDETSLEKDFLSDKDTLITVETSWGLHDRGLIALLVKGFQEQQATIELLRGIVCEGVGYATLCEGL